MNVVAFDISLSATGVARADGTLETWTHTSSQGDDRLVLLYNRAHHLVTTDEPTLAIVEDLPTHGHGAGKTGMAHGAIRCVLARFRVPVVLVPPATLKVYACGRGTARKPDMRMELYKRTGTDHPDDNAVDAAWLRLLGLDLCGAPAITLPESHRRALAKLTRPEVAA